jgi:hypothetical protein
VRLIAAAQKLGDELRERARIESRLETVDAQIEVYEGVYEMASQRMGEYRAAREEHVLEWVNNCAAGGGGGVDGGAGGVAALGRSG